jgi:flagellar M-ring protein FliF
MSPEDVTIVDQQGNLLTRRRENRDLAMAAEQFEYVRRYEETLVDRVSRILQPIVGPGRFTAEVSADVDFTRMEQAAEQYNPDGTVLRSEQSVQENNNSAVAMGIPGALSNQPPGDSQVTEADGTGNGNNANGNNNNARQQATRNFEIDRTISYTNFDPISVRRVSVAVVVDDQAAALTGAEGWSERDLEQMQALVRDAVGFSPSRGDSVTVVSQRFAMLDPGEPVEMPFWQEPWVASALKQFAAGLFLIVLVFGVFMPVLRKLASGPGNRALAGRSTEKEFDDLDMDGMSDESVTLSGGDDVLLPSPDDSYERQLGAVRGLVAQDPNRVAQVVKHWITNDG